jgi:hypothetical protein
MRVPKSILKALLSYLGCNSSTLLLGLKDAINISELAYKPDIVERMPLKGIQPVEPTELLWGTEVRTSQYR